LALTPTWAEVSYRKSIESNLANESKVFPNSGIIFIEGHIPNPMKLIFNPPMTADSLAKSFHSTIKTHEIVALPNLLIFWVFIDD
jgi:hypothetical protein